MTMLNPQTTIGELVRQRPARARVFERLGIDYCCGGKLTLSEACAGQKLDDDRVLRQLQEADARADERDTEPIDADAMGLAELADHIVRTHHAYLRRELPRLDAMMSKVAAVHGDAEPRLHELREVFITFQEEIGSHMMKEERVLFPMIRQLEQSHDVPAFHCGSIANPIAQMEREHDDAGDALARFAELTDDFTPPDWACNTFRALYDALRDLQRDMHRHVHKENNVLFPRAIALETERTGKERV